MIIQQIHHRDKIMDSSSVIDFQIEKIDTFQPNFQSNSNSFLKFFCFSHLIHNFITINKKLSQVPQNQHLLTIQDTPNITVQLSTQYLSTKFQLQINSYLLQYKHFVPNSMFLILYRTFKKEMLLLMLFVIFETGLRLMSSIFLQILIQQITLKNTSAAYLYIVLLIVSLFLKSVFYNNFYYKCYLLVNQIKACIIITISKKITQCSQHTIRNTQIGKIINMLSSDLNSIQNQLPGLFKGFIFLFTYIGCAIIMYYRLGGWGLISIVFPLFTLLIQIFLGKVNSHHINKLKQFKDQRIQLTNQAIQFIRLIKLYGWEEAFNRKIIEFRKQQILKYILINLNESFQNAISSVSGYWGILLSIIIINIRESIILSSAKILSGLDLILYFNFQYIYAVNGFNFFFQLKVIFSRFVSIYKIENIVLRKIDQQLYPQKISQQNIQIQIGQILFKNFNGYWSKNIQKPSLQNVSFYFQKDKFYGIAGNVGSGKSALLSVILKQIPYYSGTFQMKGNVAYVDQQPFIFAGTAKYNIIFGKYYDQQFYKQVIKACCLESDFKMFPMGDETIIGERGITISGGQKTRLALARAVYSRSDIYLLDDPISALDAKIARRIYDHVIKGILKNKTILLVTHQINYLQQCDQVLIMEQGRIKHSGTPYQLNKQMIKLSIKQDIKKMSSTFNKLQKIILVQQSIQPHNNNIVDKKETEQVLVNFSTYIRYFTYHKIKYLLLVTFIICCVNQLVQITFLRIFTLVDDINENKSFISSILVFLMLLCGISILIFIFNIVKTFMIYYLILKSNQNIHNDMLNNILRLPIQYFDRTSTGTLINRFTYDVGNIDSEIKLISLEQANTLFVLLSIIINIFVALPVYIPIGLIHIALLCYYCYYSFRCYNETKLLDIKQRAPILQNMEAIINGIIHLNVYKQNDKFITKMSNFIDNSSRANNNYLFIARSFNSSITNFSFIFYVFAILLGLYFIKTPALYGMLVICLLQMSQYLFFSANINMQLRTMMISVARIQNVINFNPQAKLRTQYDEQIGFKQQIYNEKKNLRNSKTNWPQQATIQFRHFDMRYRRQLDLVLNDLNFFINHGEKVAIVGRTGAGKSSIIQALLRMTEGQQHSQIFIGGYNAREMGLHSLRKSISIIPQTPFFFQGTIRHNLDPMQQESQENIWLALQESDLKKYVQSLPLMLDTDISNVNQIFSMGQKQLICLARAILRKNNILVLDEATSNVDMRTDDFIQKTLKTKFKNQTMITIAHRLTTIADYDRVIVMDKGRIVQNGKPFDLLVQNKSDNWITKKGLFAEMVLSTGQNAKLIFELAYNQIKK